MSTPAQPDGATIGPARAGAAGVLGGAAAVGLVWVLAGRAPLDSAPPPIATPPAQQLAPMPSEATPTLAAPEPQEPAESGAQPATGVDEAEPSDPQPATLALRLDLNQANAEELELLPGIGPVLAQRIVDERDRNGRFTSLLDFQRVPGIGAKKAAALEPHIRLD